MKMLVKVNGRNKDLLRELEIIVDVETQEEAKKQAIEIFKERFPLPNDVEPVALVYNYDDMLVTD